MFPSPQLLIAPESQIEDTEWLESQSDKLEESLSHFGVQATVIEAVQGPTVTRFELTVGQGTKVSRVRNLTDDLKLTLAAKEIRIQAPIPEKVQSVLKYPTEKRDQFEYLKSLILKNSELQLHLSRQFLVSA